MTKYSLLFILLIVFFSFCSKEDLSGEKVTVHKYLSEYNLFEKSRETGSINFNGKLIPIEDNIPYHLNSPLFSDYAKKFRTIYIPPNKSAYYRKNNKHIDKEVFAFPVGSIITKTFFYPADFRKEDSPVGILETRLLIRQPEGWIAVPYLWNEAQTDAVKKLGGKEIPVSFINKEGELIEFQYNVPSKNDCSSCHHYQNNKKEQIIIPIGPKARHMNTEYNYEKVGRRNQLEYFAELGKLKKLVKNPPKNINYNDTTEPIEERARAYMDINCGHCHNIKGTAGIASQLFIDYHANTNKLGRCQRPGSAGPGGGGLKYDIVPGNHRLSILWYRVSINTPGLMPQIGRVLVHKEGEAIIREWIDSMETDNCDETRTF